MSISSEILLEAAKIVEGDRNTTHGHKERSFEAIASLWTAYLQSRRDVSANIRAKDVAIMMVLMKIARSEWGTEIKDHYIDLVGYGAIAGELADI